jgi:hypothetical protein
MSESKRTTSYPVHASLTDLAKEAGIESVDDPDWAGAGWFDWERYVPYALRRLWPSLSMETKLALTLMAKERADDVDVD